MSRAVKQSLAYRQQPVSKPHKDRSSCPVNRPQEKLPVWEKDEDVSSCRSCGSKFNLLLRKHHCRSCGKIFCDTCCSNFITWPGVAHPTRACTGCLFGRSEMDYTKEYDVYEPPNPSECVVILLHGACGTRHNLIYTSEYLSKHVWVIAMDLPGMGSRSNEKLTTKSAFEAINGVVNSPYCTNKSIVLLGLNMGGYIALKFIHQFPQICHAVILVGCMNELFGLNAEATLGRMNMLYSMSSKETLANYIPNSYPNISRERILRAFSSTATNYSSWVDCKQIMLEPHEGFYRQAVRSLPKTLWIEGARDSMSAKDAFLAANKQINFHIIPNADYLCILDQNTFGAVHQLILDFLAIQKIDSRIEASGPP